METTFSQGLLSGEQGGRMGRLAFGPLLLLFLIAVLPSATSQESQAKREMVFDDQFDNCYGSFPGPWSLVSSGAGADNQKCLGGSCGPGPESCLNLQASSSAARAERAFTSSSKTLILDFSVRFRNVGSDGTEKIGIWDGGTSPPTWWIGVRFEREPREMYALDGTFLGTFSTGYVSLRFEWDREANTYDVLVGGNMASSDVPASAANPYSAKAVLVEAAATDHMAEYDVVALYHMVEPPAPNQSPAASFTFSPGTDYETRRKVTFDASASRDSDGQISKFSWTFGDGQTYDTTSASVWHNYASDGEYAVSLTVHDDDGATSTETRRVRVNLPAPSPTAQDTDGDGVPDDRDNCPTSGNDQTDSDGDAVGDACDSTPYGTSSRSDAAVPSSSASDVPAVKTVVALIALGAIVSIKARRKA